MVHDGTVVTAIWPGFHDAAFGIAFDVGSTTVAGHLCDLHTGDVVASAGDEPEIRFGEDHEPRVVRDAQPRRGEGAQPVPSADASRS